VTKEPVPLIPQISAISLAVETLGQTLATETWLEVVPETRYEEFITKLSNLLPLTQVLLQSLTPAKTLPLRRTAYPAELLQKTEAEVRNDSLRHEEESIQSLVERRITYGALYEFYVAMVNLSVALPTQWTLCLLLPEADQRLLHGHLRLAQDTIDNVLERVMQLRDDRESNLAAAPA
jgi:hypothetical protein